MVRPHLTVAILLLASAWAPTAQGEEKAPLATRIREATAKASKALAAKALAAKPESDTYAHHGRTLAALALLRVGGADARAAAEQLLERWWDQATRAGTGQYGTYELALAVSAMEALELEPIVDEELVVGGDATMTRYKARPLDAKWKDRLARASRVLLESRVRTVGELGCGWGYRTGPLVGATRDGREAWGGGADNSNTQFAALALHDAARAGVTVPVEAAEGIAEHFLKLAEAAAPGRPFRWGYGGDAGVTRSMTFAALSTLAIARDLGAKDTRLDATVARGLQSLDGLVNGITPGTTGACGWGAAYELYSLEKALDLLEKNDVNGKPWFPPLAEAVLRAQGRSGLWSQGELVDSCFYVLFLVRATVSSKRVDGLRTISRPVALTDGACVRPSTGEVVDAVKLLDEWAAARPAEASKAKGAIEEVLAAVATQPVGSAAGLLAPLGRLLGKRDVRREVAAAWVERLCGATVDAATLADAAARWEEARTSREPGALQRALARGVPLPVRAAAVRRLAEVEGVAGAAGLLVDAADALSTESVLESDAGARVARALGAAIARHLGEVPALAPKGRVEPAELRWFARVARERSRRR